MTITRLNLSTNFRSGIRFLLPALLSTLVLFGACTKEKDPEPKPSFDTPSRFQYTGFDTSFYHFRVLVTGSLEPVSKEVALGEYADLVDEWLVDEMDFGLFPLFSSLEFLDDTVVVVSELSWDPDLQPIELRYTRQDNEINILFSQGGPGDTTPIPYQWDPVTGLLRDCARLAAISSDGGKYHNLVIQGELCGASSAEEIARQIVAAQEIPAGEFVTLALMRGRYVRQ